MALVCLLEEPEPRYAAGRKPKPDAREMLLPYSWPSQFCHREPNKLPLFLNALVSDIL